MPTILEEFKYRCSLVLNVHYDEATARLGGLFEWLDSTPETKEIITSLWDEHPPESFLSQATPMKPPPASTPEQVAAVGLHFMELCRRGKGLLDVTVEYGIQPSYNTSSIQARSDEALRRFVLPGLQYLRHKLEEAEHDASEQIPIHARVMFDYPPEIMSSLRAFQKDHPSFERNAFVIIQFGRTSAHVAISEAIQATLGRFGLSALRADEKEYHDDLFGNVMTYLYGCRCGIAVFERLEEDQFSPNVALEVGFMRALRKSVCLLKDKTLRELPTDLIGKLYKPFDPQDPKGTIPAVLEKWLRDKDIVAV